MNRQESRAPFFAVREEQAHATESRNLFVFWAFELPLAPFLSHHTAR